MVIKKILPLFFFFIVSDLLAQNNSYEKAWAALNQNKWSEASKLLQDAQQDPSTFTDAYVSNLYLETYKGREDKIRDFSKSFFSKTDNPYPFVYALWFNQAVIGNQGKKQFDHQLTLINQLIKDNKAPGTLVGSANYQMVLHNIFSNDFDKMIP